MKLKEFEARQLLATAGIPLPSAVLIQNYQEIPEFEVPKILKIQTLSGGRGKAGGIFTVSNKQELQQKASEFLGKTFLNENISEILLTDKIAIKKEFYLGIMFDTSKKCPVLIFSEEGGVDIEELKEKDPSKIIITPIDYVTGLTNAQIEEIISSIAALPAIQEQLQSIIKKIYDCFIRFDCKMIEINPLALTPDNLFIALDAVAVLDDDTKFRREINFPERTYNREATPREIQARQIDRDDYRGVAGKTFLDLDGDIAILTSGGGASMTLMDALVELGGKPANFTEYSGDPPREKVEKLTRIVLDRQNLSGLLIGGVIANFTNIAETLQGVLNVLKEKKPMYPIVIRRAGPNDDEAKRILLQAKEEHGLNIHYFDEKMPLTKAVHVMIDLSTQYKQRGNSNVHSH